jgi:ATP-dependent Clp protease ATP-binding subunit ClpX
MGFGAEIISHAAIKQENHLKKLEPGDLIKYGLIPEFIGRLPIVAVLDDLDRQAMIRILSEPKNALVKQYQKIFSFEEVDLEFTNEALHEIADLAIKRQGGARGLRSVLEKLMLDLMYETPSDNSINRIIITREMVKGEGAAKILYGHEEKTA